MQEQEFERRMARHYDELKWLYCELYENRMDMFEDLCKNLGKYLCRQESRSEKTGQGQRTGSGMV